jgi:DNA-binding LytR/AlgR family response regulator
MGMDDMAVVSILIAEDEAPQRRALREALASQWPEASVVIECDNGTDALKALATHRPDVAFLDIRMPGHSGLDVALAAKHTHVVFLTAYNQYAIEAFDAGAVDYLLKPINWVRLAASITRLKERLNQSPNDFSDVLNRLKQQMQNEQRAEPIRWITATMGDVVKLLSIDDVLCFRADHKYTRVISRHAEAVIRTSIKDLVPGLNADEFWQVHRSSVVRVSAIQSVRRNELGKLQLQLDGVQELMPVSQAFQHRFKSM